MMTGTKGSVLVLQFGPVPMSYVATSYPHRILDADPNDYRDIVCHGMPKSLTDFLRKFKRDEKRSGKPRYVMNLATFAPLGAPEWNGDTSEDPVGNLWYVYFWVTRAVHRWNTALPPSRLSLLVSEFQEGSLSHVAFGPTKASEPECIFLRNTGADESWQYQWTGLPFLCERDALQHIEGAVALKDIQGDAARLNGMTEWIGGRLRGVTFGPDGSFIVYRGENFDWEGAFPPELAEALRKGKDSGWSINNCVLNPRNQKEYVLAFNEAKGLLRVYYAVHQDFKAKFEGIIDEWAKGKQLPYQSFPTELTDLDCRHDFEPSTTQRSTSRPRASLSSDSHRISISSYPATGSRNLTQINQSMLSQRSQQAPYQRYPQDPLTNGNQSQNLHPGPHNVASPTELRDIIPPRQYPPRGPEETSSNPDNIRNITNIENYWAPGSKPPKKPWFKRTLMGSANDDSNSRGRSK